MPSGDLPIDVLVLLREHVPGPSDLELLLLLQIDVKAWTVPDLAEVLGLPEAWVTDSIGVLRDAGLLTEDDDATARRFSYRPATPELDETVKVLARAYEEQPAEVVRTLNDSAIARIRSAALLAFSNAPPSGTKDEPTC